MRNTAPPEKKDMVVWASSLKMDVSCMCLSVTSWFVRTGSTWYIFYYEYLPSSFFTMAEILKSRGKHSQSHTPLTVNTVPVRHGGSSRPDNISQAGDVTQPSYNDDTKQGEDKYQKSTLLSSLEKARDTLNWIPTNSTFPHLKVCLHIDIVLCQRDDCNLILEARHKVFRGSLGVSDTLSHTPCRKNSRSGKWSVVIGCIWLIGSNWCHSIR